MRLAILLTFTAALCALPEAAAQTVTITNVTNVTEGDSGESHMVFTVSMSARPFFTTTITFSICDGTATGGEDYEPFEGITPDQPLDDRSGRHVSLRFTRNNWWPKTISVPIYGDDIFEQDETLIACLAGRGVPEGHRATGMIFNDDPPPPPPVYVQDAWIDEGDAGTANLDFLVNLPYPHDELRVAYATADGTATAGEDYEATSGELVFAPGEVQSVVSVPVLGDTALEPDETFTLAVSSPYSDWTATGVIVNDDDEEVVEDDEEEMVEDEPPTLVFVEDARTDEGDGDATSLDFSVTLSAASDIEVTVAYATADGTATAGSDYEATSGELSFAPGETEMTVSVPVLGDVRPEVDETLTVTLSNPANAILGETTATGVIVNDDTALASIADARADEGDGGMASLDFQVTLSVASDLEVTVAYATTDGTATAGADYQATSGELRFAPGETEMAVSVPVLGDTRPEADETLTVALASPVNTELGRARATGVIANDDTALASIADARMNEGDGGTTNLDFQVTLSTAGDLEVTVAYATADGTATAGSDYQAASGELRFAPGETQMTVSVSVLGDTTPETDETFTVTLGSTGNAALGQTMATGVIVDDDVADARDDALEASLAGFGRIVSHDAMSAIGDRFRGTSSTRGSQVVLGGQHLPSGAAWDTESGWDSMAQASYTGGFGTPMLHQRAQPGSIGPWRNQLSLGEFLQRSSFDLALADGGEGVADDWELSLWGRASSGRFSGRPSTGLSSDGDVVTGYLGMDAKVGERLFAGVALAHSDGDIDYGISDFGGKLDLSLTSILPYANYQVNDQFDVWGMVGFGWGEGTFRDAVSSGQTESRATQGKLDLGMSMVAVGANRALTTWQDVKLALKSDAFTTLVDGERDGTQAQPDVKARAQGMRLMLAGSKELMTSEQGRLDANLEFGGRWDGGDAQTGWGTEVAGGLDYRHADLGLGIALQGQYLLSHNARSFEDKGVSLTLEFDPGVRGQGFSLALRPAWGAYPGGAGALWNDDALLMGGTTQQNRPGIASERLNLEWGYGLGLWGGTGLLRLQGAMSQQGMGQRGYRVGGVLDVPGMARVSLELNRQEGLGESDHALLIQWNMNGW